MTSRTLPNGRTDGRTDGRTATDGQWVGFDNIFLPFFALTIAVWGTLFLKSWTRFESTLAFKVSPRPRACMRVT